jgi:hypothetical protein
LRKMSHTIYAANGKVSHIHRRMCEWDYTIDKSLVCLQSERRTWRYLFLLLGMQEHLYCLLHKLLHYCLQLLRCFKKEIDVYCRTLNDDIGGVTSEWNKRFIAFGDSLYFISICVIILHYYNGLDLI